MSLNEKMMDQILEFSQNAQSGRLGRGYKFTHLQCPIPVRSFMLSTMQLEGSSKISVVSFVLYPTNVLCTTYWAGLASATHCCSLRVLAASETQKTVKATTI